MRYTFNTQSLIKLLKKEIKLGKLKELDIFKYDPDSPFSYLSAFLRDEAVASVAPSTKYIVRRVLKAMNLKKAHVAVVPGKPFGSDDHIRMSFATSDAQLEEAARRLDAWFRKS